MKNQWQPFAAGHGIAESMFYKWNKEFMEAGKKRLAGDTTREATSDEVTDPEKRESAIKRDGGGSHASL